VTTATALDGFAALPRGRALRLVPAERRVDLAAAGLVVAQLAVYAAVALPGSFYLDDLVATNRAAASDLTLSYLRGPDGHHLAPGSMVWFWLQAHLLPLDHTAAVLVTLAVQGGATVALWRLLRALVGPSALALVPLALYTLSPLSLPTFAWWIQSVCLLPVHLSLIGATYQQLRYLRTHRLRHAAAAGGWVVLGLLFWEKAVLAAVLPFLLTLVAFTVRGQRVRGLLRQWPAWVCLGAPLVAFVLVYNGTDRQPGRQVAATKALDLLQDSTTHFVLPSLLGGPWTWTTRDFYGIADPPGLLVVLSSLAVVGLAVVSVRRRRAALRGWLLLALYLPLSLAPVAASRLELYGTDVGRDSRYLTDVSVVAAVALALVLLPLREEPPQPPRRRPVVTTAAVIAALAVSSAVSDVAFARHWQDNPTSAYLARLQTGLEDQPGSVALYDAQLPLDVISPFYRPWNSLSALLEQLPGRARFEDGLTPLKVVRQDGAVVAGRLKPLAHNVPGPDGSCGYTVTSASPARIPLDRTVLDVVDRTVRVELLLSLPAAIDVEVNGRQVGDGRVLPGGPAAVVALLPGASVDAVVVRNPVAGSTACVLSVTVGTPVPLAAP
jgi:hypothetical protein